VGSLVLSGGSCSSSTGIDLTGGSFSTSKERKGAYDAVRTMQECVDVNTPDCDEIDTDTPSSHPLLTAMVANLSERAETVRGRGIQKQRGDDGWGVLVGLARCGRCGGWLRH